MAVERTPSGSSLIDVLDRVLDKGIVIDAWVRVSLVGIDLVTVEARIVVASIDTYLKYSEAVGITAPVSRPREIGCRRRRARAHARRERRAAPAARAAQRMPEPLGTRVAWRCRRPRRRGSPFRAGGGSGLCGGGLVSPDAARRDHGCVAGVHAAPRRRRRSTLELVAASGSRRDAAGDRDPDQRSVEPARHQRARRSRRSAAEARRRIGPRASRSTTWVALPLSQPRLPRRARR